VTILLITGSRKSTPAALNYARQMVQGAKVYPGDVMVGDAEGVDQAVMNECHRLGVKHVICGAYTHLRRSTPSGTLFLAEGLNYLERDELMASKCDWCIAIWNGQSRGTKYTYDKALARLGSSRCRLAIFK